MIVKQVHLTFLNQYVRDNDPFEACAILLGKRQNDEFVIEEIVPAQNKDSSITRFTIENDRLYEIYKMANEKNLSVIGIFHSHPSDPNPSSTDKLYMKVNPIPWIIKSTVTNEVRCFIYGDQANGNETQINEIQIKIMG